MKNTCQPFIQIEQLKTCKLSSVGFISLALMGAFASSQALAQDFPMTELMKEYEQQKYQSKAVPSATEAKMAADILEVYDGGLLSKSANRERVPVVIKAQSGSQQLKDDLQSIGVSISIQDGNDVYGYAYPSQLKDIAALASVSTISKQPITSINSDADELLGQLLGDSVSPSTTPIIRPSSSSKVSGSTPNTNDVGFQKMYADKFHEQGYYGQGLKIGVIDFGYHGYNEVKARGLLPNPVATRKFNGGYASGQLTTGSGTEHGTAVTEIIYNQAPQATYYLAQVGNGSGSAASVDIKMAMDWMEKQGVNIINYSGGGQGGSHNGTTMQDRKVEELDRKGILFVTSAGNDADNHWSGQIKDNDNSNYVDMGYNDFLRFRLKKTRVVNINLNWDDWGDKTAVEGIDLDMYLVNKYGEILKKDLTARYSNTVPRDGFKVQLPKGLYGLALSTNKYSNKNVHVYISNVDEFLDNSPRGSIGIPGTSKGALTVGAWDVRKERIADYSSQGRTDDNRNKPEISAPAGAKNTAYELITQGDGRFHGTSAASPYAAGFAALVWTKNPNWTSEQVKSFMINSAPRAISAQTPSIASGYGLLDARQALGSSVTPAKPTNGHKTPSRAGKSDADVLLNQLLSQ